MRRGDTSRSTRGVLVHRRRSDTDGYGRQQTLAGGTKVGRRSCRPDDGSDQHETNQTSAHHFGGICIAGE